MKNKIRATKEIREIKYLVGNRIMTGSQIKRREAMREVLTDVGGMTVGLLLSAVIMYLVMVLIV